MPSVDVVSELDVQEIDNAINTVNKELANRYDFRGSKTEVELDKKSKILKILTEDDMKLKAIREMIVARIISRKVSPQVFEYGEPESATQGMLRVQVKLKEGLSTEDCRRVVKLVKESKLKVQAASQGDQVRLTGPKIDDLQTIMAILRADTEISVPLQFTNMKR
jgi:uncharacterized protein YajQ (UPF0234 family)